MPPRATRALSVFLLAPLIAVVVNAADIAARPAYEGQRILNVRFDPPAQPVSSDDLNRLLTWKPGDALHLTDVRATIKRLYATGAFSTIDVDTAPAAGGVEVIVRTTEQWFVGPVEASGKMNAPPNEGQLADASRLDLGQPFREDDLTNAVQGIRGLLERNGLYNAKITPRVDRDPQHQEVAITFDVEAGKRARLMEPQITGDTRLTPEQVAKDAKYKGWFRWKPATDENVQAGIHNILGKYAGKNRLTASVTLDKREYVASKNRVQTYITANGGPVVKITAQEAKISRGKLKKYVPVFEEQSVNNDLLVSGARNLRDYFQFQGYFDVQVDFKTANPSADQEEITYRIGLGERHRVASVAVKGNRYFQTPDIRARMYTQSAGFIRLRHGRYSESFAKRDEDAIEALYQDNGFRDAKVTTATVNNYRGKKGDVAVTYAIAEGPQYLVSSFEVNGLTLANRSAILRQLASVPGEPYSETNVAIDRDYILSRCTAAGYASAEFNFHAAPGQGEHDMTLQYEITLGPFQRVRDVLITGMRTTRYSLIKPAIRMEPGDPLSLDAMGAIQRRLYNLGVFDKVDMAVQDPDGDMQDKYVVFHLDEGHRYNLAVGVGAQVARFGGNQQSLNSPSGTTGFAPNFDFEISRLNMWGLGHSLNFKSRYSTLDRRASINYLAPRFRNVDGSNLSFTALYDNTRDVLTFTAVTYQGSLQYSRKLSKPTTMLVRYTWRDSKVDQSTLKINPLLIPIYSQPSRVAEFGTSLVQDRRDNAANAHRGIYNSLDVDLAEQYFGGQKNFLRFLGRNSYYKSFGNYTIASNTEFGVIWSFNLQPGFIPSTYIPLPERFFGGGQTTDRGFPYDEAGPRDPETGFPLGGNALFFHSTEFRFPLIGDNVGGILFHDFGNIFTGLSRFSFRVHQNGLEDFNYMVHAAGFGISYHTPLGPVRIDLAYSINPPTFNGLKGTYQQLVLNQATPAIQSVSHFQFFFTIGQAF
ncbi:MAG TPA: POTRA domain-containing protein [Bryobacteraceae bacterium]|jgi:outer membrane protein assembly complex protein YaeT|nr:POTRA domain-containing protein [Bryobacteraceae bacterium]